MEAPRTADVRFLVLAAFAGIGVVIALAAGYLWGVRRGTTNVAASVAQEAEDAERARRLEEPPSSTRKEAGIRLPMPSAASSTGTEPPEPPSLSPEEGRARHIARLTSSGPDNRGLLADARRAGEEWSGALAAKRLAVTFDDWHCFRAGCFVSAKHDSAAAVEGATDVITRSKGFMRWNGEKIRTGPVLMPDGKTEVAWILLPPPEGEAAFPSDAKD